MKQRTTDTMRKVVPLLMFLCASKTNALEISQCIAPLGMETGLIKDADITASSSFDHGNVGPHHGRARTELYGGAWCPQTPATPSSAEWLEIDLHSVHMITATESQGRFGNGQGVEFAESYMLEYYRPRLNKWIRYRSRGGELLPGNINTYTERKTDLDPPILASKIRFLPYSSHKRTVCMRVEIYGCRWSDGIVSYTMPQGDKRGTNWEFYDMAYDGVWDGEKLKYGLGQLTDGQLAADDFKKAFLGDSVQQNWVGWKNDTRGNSPIEIEFEFDKVREFTALHIYVNNQFTKDVQVFSQARVYFSIGGKIFKGEPITFDYMDDRIFEDPRNISIKLRHKVGKFVRLQLFFAARWLLVSEVTFESLPATVEYAEEAPLPSQTGHAPRDTPPEAPTSAEAAAGLGRYLGAAVGALAVLLVLLAGGGAWAVAQQRRCKRAGARPHGGDKKMLYGGTSLTRAAGGSDYSDDRCCDPEYAVPLQAPSAGAASVRTPPALHRDFFPRPPPVPPPPAGYYAAAEVCRGAGPAPFVPPPPPAGPPPAAAAAARHAPPPRYANGRGYGPP